jgi:large subunit ribosomal protein L32e
MTTENKRLIRVRTDKGASFKRDGFGKKRQLSDSWRKPRGQHNKQREQKKAKGALPKPGFGSPVAVRGMHPSGFFEVLVCTLKELEGIDAKTHAVRISATVGAKNRLVLQQKAIEAGLKVLNTRVIKEPVKKENVPESAKDKAKGEKVAKSKAVPVPKKEKSPKATDAKKSGEPKKAAKPATQSKSQEKPVKKAADKPEAKAVKVPAKEAETATKKPAKPKAEISTGSAKEKPAAESKAQPKKKTSTGVKKNE